MSDFLRALCNLEKSPLLPLNTNQVLQEHKLFGAFENVYPGDSHLAALEAKKTRQQNILIRHTYEEILQLVEGPGIRPVLLKGPALLGRIYKDWSLRPISDLDLLVQEEEVEVLSEALEKSGFKRDEEKKWRANHFKTVWTHPTLEVSVEVHTKLFAKEPEDFFWLSERNPYGPGYTLKDNYFFIHLVGHLAHQHTFLKIFWLMDLHQWVKQKGLEMDWMGILNLARELKLETSFDATMYCLNDLLQNPYTLPSIKKKWRKLLSWELLTDTRERKTNYYLLKHLLKDSLVEAFSYDFLWLKNRLSSGKLDKSLRQPSPN